MGRSPREQGRSAKREEDDQRGQRGADATCPFYEGAGHQFVKSLPHLGVAQGPLRSSDPIGRFGPRGLPLHPCTDPERNTSAPKCGFGNS